MAQYTLYIATQNRGKLRELTDFFQSSPRLASIKVKSLEELGPDIAENFDPEETGETFMENAKIKAQALHEICKTAVIADDSGLEVDALGSRPGVKSSRYAPTDPERIAKLLGELKNIEPEQRTARFVCSICLVEPSGTQIYFNGTVEGEIALKPAGEGGFGYDPVFYYPPFGKTFGELTTQEKAQISHRSKALKHLCDYLERSLDEP